MKESKHLVTQKELAKENGVCESTIRRVWHKQGCPRVYVGSKCKGGRGSRPRYDLAAVRAWLESRTAGTARKGVEA